MVFGAKREQLPWYPNENGADAACGKGTASAVP